MRWIKELTKNLNGPEVVNDSKTPSGRVHVGALRGVLLHDLIHSYLGSLQINSTYLYGVDDYDPLDEVPRENREFHEGHAGKPLSKVPPPPGSGSSSLAEHYMADFLETFSTLDVHVKLYRMSRLYESGQFNELIAIALRRAAVIRQIYFDVSGAVRPPGWLPVQIICENCGRIGTTIATALEEFNVSYHCSPDAVEWARGCGYRGRRAPFDGAAKLPWKIEWPAKWKHFGVTVEGAGKDHSTRGGARDVAERIAIEVFGCKPPMNVPYEFFLVAGSKMSSSKGVGVSAKQMADMLPSELIRFLMLVREPTQPVNFFPDRPTLVNLHNQFDRVATRSAVRRRYSERYLAAAGVPNWGPVFVPDFDLVLSVCQDPTREAFKDLSLRKSETLTEVEQSLLERRIQTARYWLANFAPADEKVELQRHVDAPIPASVLVEAGFLAVLLGYLANVSWDADELQNAIFESARESGRPIKGCFRAVYEIFLGHLSGPRAGKLLAELGRAFVMARLRYAVNQCYEGLESRAIPLPRMSLAHLRGDRVKVELLFAFRESSVLHEGFEGLGVALLRRFEDDELEAVALLERFSGLRVDMVKEREHLLEYGMEELKEWTSEHGIDMIA